MSTRYSVLAEGLVKRYGDKLALDGFDLAVARGTVFGLLGPNGAGKTTAVRILTTLVRLDGGRASVGGFDVMAQPRQVRRRIGLTGQSAAVDEILSARQNLVMFGRLFHLEGRVAKRRAEELLEQFSLTEAADASPKTFSGGMRRRLDLAASMILAPQVLFLDEPTTGLDPRGRSEVWDAVRNLAAGGTTVLLTTHYLDEADKLSDRIALIDRGRGVSDDTPAALKRAIGGDRLEIMLEDPADLAAVVELVARVCDAGAPPQVDEAQLRVQAPVSDRVLALTEAARSLHDRGIGVRDIGLRGPTLDEVFLALTGHPAADEDAAGAVPSSGSDEDGDRPPPTATATTGAGA